MGIHIYIPNMDVSNVSSDEREGTKTLVGLIREIYPELDFMIIDVDRKTETSKFPSISPDRSCHRYEGLKLCIQYLISKFGKKAQVGDYLAVS